MQSSRGEDVLAEGQVRTPDLGGRANTTELGEAVHQRFLARVHL